MSEEEMKQEQTDIRAEKARRRAEGLAQRCALTPEAAEARSAVLCAHLQALPAVAAARVLAGYMAIRGEASVEAVLRDGLRLRRSVALPRVVPGTGVLTLHAVTDFAALVPGPYRIPEPPADAPVITPESVDVFLVPGVAFDAGGRRLGYGAGYYDKLLPTSHGLRIGVAFACQVLPMVPFSPHDALMDLLVTEEGVIVCRSVL